MEPIDRRRCAGMTLVETASVSLVVAVLTAMISSSLARLSTTHAYSRDQTRLVEVADRMMRVMMQDATFSAHVFTSGVESTAYLMSLQASPFPALIGSRLPAVTSRGYFETDPVATPETGNMLFMGEGLPPFITDLDTSGTPDLVRVDRLRFVLWYVTRAPDGSLDLVRWTGAPMARLSDLQAIADLPRRQDVGLRLYEAGVRLAWNPGATRVQGLWQIASTGDLSPLPLMTKVPPDAAQPTAVMLATKHVSVAKNGSFPIPAVPAYAAASGAFPAGFEVKVDGSYGAKLVLLRLVLTSGLNGSYKNHAEVVRLVSCRDG